MWGRGLGGRGQSGFEMVAEQRSGAGLNFTGRTVC